MSNLEQNPESVPPGAHDLLTHRMDRRGFIARAAVVGAAAAVAPTLLAAGPPPGRGNAPQVVPPPFQVNPLLSPRHRIVRSDVSAAGEEGRVGIYLARPADVASAPGVLVIHENRGMVPYVRDVVDGLATNGFIAAAADLLSRDGGTGIVSFDDAPSHLNPPTQARHTEDLISTLDLLGNQPGVGRVGVIGFCFGGALTWRLAVHSPSLGFSAVIPCYGAAPPDVQAAAGNIDAPVFAVYAETDNNVNATRDGILAAMDGAGTTYQTKTYPGTLHAFHNHTNPDRYHAGQAAELWRDALDWFQQHLS